MRLVVVCAALLYFAALGRVDGSDREDPIQAREDLFDECKKEFIEQGLVEGKCIGGTVARCYNENESYCVKNTDLCLKEALEKLGGGDYETCETDGEEEGGVRQPIKLKSAVVNLRKDRRLHHPHRNKWVVIIDCWKAAGSGTGMGTSNPITVKFFNKRGRLLGSTTRRSGANKCWDKRTRWSIKTSGRVRSIKIKIKGENAYLIDKVLVRKNGRIVAKKNKDYCLSEYKNDHLGRWEAFVNKCRKRLRLPLPRVPITLHPTTNPPTSLLPTTTTPTTSAPTNPPPTEPPTIPQSTTPATTSPTTPPSTMTLSWIQVGTDVDGPNAGDEFGGAVAFSNDGMLFAVGARSHSRDNIINRGLVRVYKEEGGSWAQIGSDLLGDAANDYFGTSVTLSGDGKRVAIGAPRYDDNVKGSDTGQTKVFEYQSETWVLLGSRIVGEAGGDRCGVSVSMSYDGNVVAIGANVNEGANGVNSGHVRVYQFLSNDWIQLGGDLDGEAADDYAGSAVSLSEDGLVVAIGAWQNDDNGVQSGQARVFEYQSSSWHQRGQDVAGAAEFDYSGWSVSLSADGNIVAVGAWGNDANGVDSGHVRVYEYSSTTDIWMQLGADIHGEAHYDRSGYSVSISTDGTIVAVGAVLNDGRGTNAGHVRVYRFDGDTGTWVQVGGNIDGESTGDYFGESVNLSGDGSRVVIGAPLNDGNGTNSGHVRAYELIGER